MKRLLLTFVFLPCLLAQQADRSAEVISADGTSAPTEVVSDGLFVLDVKIGDSGSVEKVEALRNPGGMLGAADSSIRNWKFSPGSDGGKTRNSRMTVAFVYRPANYPNFGAVPVKPFSPVIPSAAPDESSEDTAPVGILSFAYADYPVNSVASGAVVLQATVDADGSVKKVDVIHGMAGFDRFAQTALKNWRFRAGTARGNPVTSKIAVAFVFQPPVSE